MLSKKQLEGNMQTEIEKIGKFDYSSVKIPEYEIIYERQ